MASEQSRKPSVTAVRVATTMLESMNDMSPKDSIDALTIALGSLLGIAEEYAPGVTDHVCAMVQKASVRVASEAD